MKLVQEVKNIKVEKEKYNSTTVAYRPNNAKMKLVVEATYYASLSGKPTPLIHL